MNYKRIKKSNGQLHTSVYKINDDGTVLVIPSNTKNRDWNEYQVWIGKGNTAQPAD